METITLATGTSYFRSPEAATTAAMEAIQAGKTLYGPHAGTDSLRAAVANRYASQGVHLDPAQVLITPGTKQALYNLFTVLLRPNDEVVVPTPAWFGFKELMKYSKGRLVPLETRMEEGYALTPEALRSTLNAASRILVLTNPGNPTGRTYSKTELEALLEVINDYPDLYVVSDEIYDFLSYSEPVASLFSCQGAAKERTVVVNGFSKSFAMSGWRLGYIAGPAALVAKCIDFQASTLAGVSVFLQDAAQATLEHQAQALPPMLEVLRAHRQIMKAGLDEIPEVGYYFPDGAYYFFPDFSFYLGRATPAGETLHTAIDLCRYLSEQYHLELSPGDYFDGPGHARMSFAVQKHELQEAMHRLKEALAQLKQPGKQSITI